MDGAARRLAWQQAAAAQQPIVAAQLRQRDLPRRLRERLELVKGVGLGQDLPALCAWSGRSPRRVAYWLDRFVAGGVAALAAAPRSGRPAKADAAYRTALVVAVEPAPRTLGLEIDVWTAAQLSAYLTEQTGTRIAPGWVRALLARERFACGRPTHTLGHLQDPEAVAACVAELAAVGEKGGGGAGALRAPS